MPFTQLCFIRKNTPELRKKLEDLGYISHIFNNNDANNIYADKLGTYISVDIENQPYYIDCGTNEELFLALAALKDDIDINQWFINTNNYWYKCLDNKFSKETADWVSCTSADKWHKAAVEEIIEHFK